MILLVQYGNPPHGTRTYVATPLGNLLQGSRTALTKRARELRKQGVHTYLVPCAPSLFHLGVAPDADAARALGAASAAAHAENRSRATEAVQQLVRSGRAGLGRAFPPAAGPSAERDYTDRPTTPPTEAPQ